jgi:hypothetical protein
LQHPLFETLEAICTGKTSPAIFPFYHIGVTISATRGEEGRNLLFSLESPSVINGCQTITLANAFLEKLEKEADTEQKQAQLALFNEIQVIAKIVIGVSGDELREITNANNRQNPIENWQLYSNDPIHIAIELALKDNGVFYERQKGKFDSMMRVTANAASYYNTNGTYIEVGRLGQVIAFAKKELQLAAKPSLIFEQKKHHDHIFDSNVERYPNDMVFCTNLLRAFIRALTNHLRSDRYLEDGATQSIFAKPIVKAHLFYLCLIFYFQHPTVAGTRVNYATQLARKASPTLVGSIEEQFLPRTFAKIKRWYYDESQKLDIEVSAKKMNSFFKSLFLELKLDERGLKPFH